LVAFTGDAVRELAAQFLALAEKQGAAGPLMTAHRLMGLSLMYMGDIAEGRAYLDRAIALYDPTEHRLLARRFGVDAGVVALSYRSMALWLLGYPEAALADSDQALSDAREVAEAATLMNALVSASGTNLERGNYATANAQAAELVALADEKGASEWKAVGMNRQGYVLALTGRAADAVHMITSGITAWRSTGATLHLPWSLSSLAAAHAELGQLDEAALYW
jgi:tetratricopeptide (TPR) repeat protein